MLELILNGKVPAVAGRNGICNKICNTTDHYVVDFVEGKSQQWRDSPNKAIKIGGYAAAGAVVATYLALETLARGAEFATRGLGELSAAGWKKLPSGVREKPEELAGKVGEKYEALPPNGKRGVWACGAIAGLALLFSGGDDKEVVELLPDQSLFTEKIADLQGRRVSPPIRGRGGRPIGGVPGPHRSTTNMCEVQANYSVEQNKPVLLQRMDQVDIAQAPEGLNRLGFKKHLDNQLDGNNLEIYFPFDESTISENDLNDIRAYLQGFKGNLEELTVEGYACSMGGENINLGLSEKRADAVARVLRDNVNRNIPLHQAAYGEKKSNGSEDQEVIQYDRKVRIVPNATPIQAGLDLLPSDHYLVDQSSSMAGAMGRTTKWNAVQKYRFPRDSSVYTFTSSPRTCGEDLAHSRPMGGTPLYQALHELVGKAKHGESITVLSDGQHTGSTAISPYNIIRAAKAKDLQINVLGLGLNGHAERVMKDIANGTGGAVYMAGRNI